MTLTAPKDDKSRAVLRALAEAGASFFPLAGALARLYQTTHPAQFAREVEHWQGDITATVNALDARLSALEARHQPKLVLSDVAFDIALWLVADADRPPHWPVSQGDIVAGLPDQEPGLIAEAVHELADLELVKVTPSLGDGGDRVRALWPLIWLFEPLASGVSPVRDAAALAVKALTTDHLEAQAIHDEKDWTVRRVNAAFALVATFAPPTHVRSPSHPVFDIYGIHVEAGTRRRLRAFIGAPAAEAPAPPQAAG